MNLDDAQKQKVAEWIKQDLTLSQIQGKLASELDIHMTYMEVRFLMDDLKLKPKDKAPPVVIAPAAPAGGPAAVTTAGSKASSPAKGSAPTAGQPPAGTGGGVSLSVDHLARPGALVSGKVTFSDGNSAEWYLDQMGRLGLVPAQQGYRPPQQDLQAFQVQLQDELQKLGL